MGGSGSGAHYYHWWRGTKKTVVEHCRQLDAVRFTREGVLRAGAWSAGSWCWWRDAERTEKEASVCYEVDTTAEPPWLRLSYNIKATGDELDYRVGLVATRPRFGGLRWWFICPLSVNGQECDRRVRKLYLPPGGRYFGCRHCHELTYTSCQESHKYDGLYGLMARNTGYDLATVRRLMNRLGKGQ
jgi:hypothetical protein